MVHRRAIAHPDPAVNELSKELKIQQEAISKGFGMAFFVEATFPYSSPL